MSIQINDKIAYKPLRPRVVTNDKDDFESMMQKLKED